MSAKIDLTGQKFGRLTVISDTGRRSGNKVVWLCQCDCGRMTETTGNRLTSGNTKSCGCLQKDKAKARMNDKDRNPAYKHGGRFSRLYRIWRDMKQRCLDKNFKFFYNYGGRGITICDEWLDSFEAFRDWALANGYRDDLSIDRKDNDGPYCPENCRWATAKEQRANQRPYKRHNKPKSVG